MILEVFVAFAAIIMWSLCKSAKDADIEAEEKFIEYLEEKKYGNHKI